MKRSLFSENQILNIFKEAEAGVPMTEHAAVNIRKTRVHFLAVKKGPIHHRSIQPEPKCRCGETANWACLTMP
jgi:hypothetical protein